MRKQRRVPCPNQGRCQGKNHKGKVNHELGSVNYRLCDKAARLKARVQMSDIKDSHTFDKKMHESYEERFGFSGNRVIKEFDPATEQLKDLAYDMRKYTDEPILRYTGVPGNIDLVKAAEEKYIETGDVSYALLKEEHFN